MGGVLGALAVIISAERGIGRRVLSCLEGRSVPVGFGGLSCNSCSTVVPGGRRLNVTQSVCLGDTIRHGGDISRVYNGLRGSARTTFRGRLVHSRGNGFVVFIRSPRFSRGVTGRGCHDECSPGTLGNHLRSFRTGCGFRVEPVDGLVVNRGVCRHFLRRTECFLGSKIFWRCRRTR